MILAANKNSRLTTFVAFGEPPGVEGSPIQGLVGDGVAVVDFSGAFSGRAPGLRASHVDMILRSSPAAARQTLRITRIWDGEIVFENVPLRWND